MGDDGLRGFMRDVNKEGDLDKRDLNKGNAKKPAPAILKIKVSGRFLKNSKKPEKWSA